MAELLEVKLVEQMVGTMAARLVDLTVVTLVWKMVEEMVDW